MSEVGGGAKPLRPVEFEILVSLASGSLHGYAILRQIEARRGSAPGMTTLYRALRRLAETGLTELEDSVDDDDRRDVYRLTEAGRRAAALEARRLEALLGAARRARLLGG